MISATLSGVRRILCLGAHSDDIEIGCGGTLLHLLRQSQPREICWVVFCSKPEREREAKKSAAWFLKSAAKSTVFVKTFRDGFLPYNGAEVKDCFEEIKQTFEPDIVFTHTRHDLHQDHRLLCELTWNTFRNHLILEYEIPKYDADLRSPNIFVPLSAAIAKRKVDALMRFFGTQRNKHWFTPDLFNAVMRLRGIESASPTLFAEGFYARKLLLQ